MSRIEAGVMTRRTLHAMSALGSHALRNCFRLVNRDFVAVLLPILTFSIQIRFVAAFAGVCPTDLRDAGFIQTFLGNLPMASMRMSAFHM